MEKGISYDRYRSLVLSIGLYYDLDLDCIYIYDISSRYFTDESVYCAVNSYIADGYRDLDLDMWS